MYFVQPQQQASGFEIYCPEKITNILIVIVQPQHQAPGFENMIKIYPDLFKFNPNLSK